MMSTTAMHKISLFQQNGSLIMNSGGTTAQLRSHFRRQPSNFGGPGPGHVSPMAVMVVPNRIDYSMTKGGLRMWVVLLVFFFLCSSLYTIFSAQELAELPLSIEDDENIDYDGEIEDNGDEMANHNRRFEKDTMPSKANVIYSKVSDEIRRFHQGINDDAADDEIGNDHEEILLAGLREKSKGKIKKAPYKNEKENQPFQDKKSKSRKQNKAKKFSGKIEESRNMEIDDTSYKRQQRTKPKRIHQNSLDNEDTVKDGVAAQSKDEVEKENEENDEKEVEESAKEKTVVDDEPQKVFETSDEPSTKESTEEEVIKKKVEKPQKECKRKYCPPEYDNSPRMSLLKQKPHSVLNRGKHHILPRTDAPRYASRDDNVRDIAFDDDDEGDDEKFEELIKDDEDENDEEDEIDVVLTERWTDRGTYKRHAITNKDDHRYREQLDKADYLVEKHKYREAFEIFEEILNRNPDSPRAHFGRARAFDIRGEMESNKFYLDLAINEYQEVLDIDDTPDALFRQAAYRLIDRARFRNSLHKALQAQRSLIDRYPDDLQLQNDFALTFLMMNRNEDALKVFQNVLKIQPNNAVAQAYYGYIIKLNGDLENGVLHMRKGLKAARHLIADPKFYYHFGDALTKLGRKKDAFEVYSIGAKVGLFLSPYQRSLYNYDGLTARPWWSIDQTTYAKYLKHIERQWTIIREEAVRLLESNPESFIAENKELTIGGTWSAYYIYRVGSWERENCLKIPKTCELVRRFKEESNATKNEMKISLLTSGTRVWPYCGYSNSRLRAQLGLVVPSDARIRVADETRGWKTGKFIVFDDSFEHELWFVGASQKKYRLILEIDLWHPEIEPSRRITLDGF